MSDKISSAANPTLQDLVKVAAATGIGRVSLEDAAASVLGSTKTASAPVAPTASAITRDFAERVASACRVGADALRKEASEVGPGKGPGSLEVTEATHAGSPASSIHPGKARVQPPSNPPLHSARPGDAATQVENNMDHPGGKTAGVKDIAGKVGLGIGLTGQKAKHHAGEAAHAVSSKVKGIANKVSDKIHEVGEKADAAIGGPERRTAKRIDTGLEANPHGLPSSIRDPMKKDSDALHSAARSKALKTTGKAVGGTAALTGAAAGIHHATKKEDGGSDDGDKMASMGAALRARLKQANDPTAPPPGASAAGEGGNHQPGSRGMLESTDKLRNLTRRDAKANAREGAAPLVREPVQSAATDATLQQAFAHTGQAGAKIASDDAPAGGTIKNAAAARAFLSNLLEGAV